MEKYGPAFAERKRHPGGDDAAAAGLRVLADPNRITQVLNNLLTNAVKFTPRGRRGDGASCGATSARRASWRSRAGTPASPSPRRDLERIFDRFEQARTVRSTAPCAAPAWACPSAATSSRPTAGRIWAEPCAGGARFVVVLPVEPPLELLEPAGETAGRRRLQRQPRGTVLVVEDEPRDRLRAQGDCCCAAGYQVAIAATGDEALALARKLQARRASPLDVRLPDVDGLRLAEIFRHDPDTRSTRR